MQTEEIVARIRMLNGQAVHATRTLIVLLQDERDATPGRAELLTAAIRALQGSMMVRRSAAQRRQDREEAIRLLRGGRCPHCDEPAPGPGSITCGASGCQQAEYHACMERAALRRKKGA
jgi:hypothetical protein